MTRTHSARIASVTRSARRPCARRGRSTRDAPCTFRGWSSRSLRVARCGWAGRRPGAAQGGARGRVGTPRVADPAALSGTPRSYRIWRAPGIGAIFVQIAEVADPSFEDTSAVGEYLLYDVTPVW